MNSRWWGPCVWCFLSVLALALPADADAEEYYVADGKKIALTPSPRYHAFETKADALSDFEARIRKMPDLTIEGSGAPLLERRGIVLVKRSPGAAPGEFMKSIRALSTDPAVVSEAPVFSVGGIDQLLLNEFIVQFKKGVTQADVDGLLKRHDAEIPLQPRLQGCGPGLDAVLRRLEAGLSGSQASRRWPQSAGRGGISTS